MRRGRGLRPGSGRSPGAPASAGARPRAAGGGHGSGGAGAPGGARLLRALSGSQRRLLGRARPAVTSARLPPPPSPHPDQCGMEGAEASCEGRPASRPGASFLPPRAPRASQLCPGSRGAIQAFRSPHHHPRALPGSSRATNNLGGGGAQRVGSLAGSSELRNPGCFGENGELRRWGRLLSGLKGGLFFALSKC